MPVGRFYPVTDDYPAPVYPEYPGLLEQAHARTRGFVNPRELGQADRIAFDRGYEWAACVLGRPWRGERYMPWLFTELVKAADAANVNPPLPQWLIDARAEEAARTAREDAARREREQRVRAAWDAARADTDVPVELRPNTQARARGGYREYLVHVVPTAPAVSRRSRQHAAGRALCETATRARPLALGAVTDAPATCQSCLTYVKIIRPASEGTP